MTDERIQAISKYLDKGKGSAVVMTIILGVQIVVALVSGQMFGLIIALVCAVVLVYSWFGVQKSSERAAEQPLIYVGRHGAETLCNDFEQATARVAGDDFRLGERFLYSSAASRILAYSEIVSVHYYVSTNVDSADDYAIVCVLEDRSRVTVSTHGANEKYVSVIEARAQAARKKAGLVSGAQCDKQAELKRLRLLYEAGVITEEEYRKGRADQECL